MRKVWFKISNLVRKGGLETNMDGDSSDDANCIPLMKYSSYVRHIYTAMDRVGAPFCVVFSCGRAERMVT